MGVPKQRHTKSRRDKRRMHLYIKEPSLAKCPKCGQDNLSHQACFNCGTYNKREVIDVLGKLTKKERKQKEREIAAAEAAKKKPADAKAMAGKEGKGASMEELSK